MDSLPDNLSLKGQYAALEPLTKQHCDALLEAASDGELWNLSFTSVPGKSSIGTYLDTALSNKQLGEQFPFVVRRLSDDKIVGSTRYYRISSQNRNLSIGYTWYAASAQRTAINTECKYLLLTYAFEELGCLAVMWHTHHENVRSRQAILRLGAKQDGILRNDLIMPDGNVRHTVCFSMLKNEWPDSKAFLKQRLGHSYRLS